MFSMACALLLALVYVDLVGLISKPIHLPKVTSWWNVVWTSSAQLPVSTMSSQYVMDGTWTPLENSYPVPGWLIQSRAGLMARMKSSGDSVLPWRTP